MFMISLRRQTRGHRSNNFDFLRFFFAALVIFSHSFDLMGGKGANPISQFTRCQIDGGSVAVNGFFIISGFLIAQSFLNSRSVLDYFKRRVLRIYPGFVTAAIISLVFFGWLGMHFSRAYWQNIEPLIFLQRLPILKQLWIPQTFHDSHWPLVNGPIWTIQYEFVCYILIALLGIAGILQRRAFLLILFASVFVFYVLQIANGSLSEPAGITLYNWKEFPIGGAPDNYPRFLTYFFLGTIAFLYRERITYSPGIAVLFVVATLIIARLGHWMDIILPFSLCYLVLFVAFDPRIALQNWAKHGDFSYGLYLYGWPVQQSLILLCRSWITPWLVFVLSLPLTLLFAVGSWYLIERRFLRLKQHHLQFPTGLTRVQAPQYWYKFGEGSMKTGWLKMRWPRSDNAQQQKQRSSGSKLRQHDNANPIASTSP
jgi:peptidoglycan/LPS O-acetylase OafA/YrhL